MSGDHRTTEFPETEDRSIGSRQAGRNWDSPSVQWQLARLTASRSGFRIRRTMKRLRSPRRIVATCLAVLFFALYLLNGIYILSARTPADPERLRLWLSGGMVIYAIYHFVRCAWSKSIADLELTSAENLWLGGAPIRRSSLAVYHMGNVVTAAMLKTFLLAVVLARDVGHLELLIVGVFSSLVLLESVRLIIQRFSAGLRGKTLLRFRVALSLIAASLVIQILARMVAATPMGSPTWKYVLSFFQSLGKTAACDAIQWLSIPWIAAAQVAVTENYKWVTLLQLIASAAVVPLSIMLLVRVDAWAVARQARHERECLEANRFQRTITDRDVLLERGTHPQRSWLQQRLPRRANDSFTLIARQAISVRRYRGTIAFSFAIPILLCLSPLCTGQVTQQWLFVVGGIALCTMLLAPPALKIDFRRDLRRMLMLRSIPVRPLSMVLGQLTLPILITWVFQWITIFVAAIVTQPGIPQVLLWTGMLNALAVLTFAAENALFLVFPHHQHSEGVAMMVRAKLTFLAKAAVLALAIAGLGAWAITCQRLPEPWVAPTMVGGALAATWSIAAVAIAVCAGCWRRFDLTLDVPPE